jgi:hypothetical protein
VAPTRALDTRVETDSPATPVAAGEVVTLAMTPWLPAYATAVAVNVTVTQTSAAGFATVYPCGAPPPTASNVNFVADEDRATQAIVGLGNGGLCIYLSATAHLIVDLWDGSAAVMARVSCRPKPRGWSTREQARAAGVHHSAPVRRERWTSHRSPAVCERPWSMSSRSARRDPDI